MDFSIYELTTVYILATTATYYSILHNMRCLLCNCVSVLYHSCDADICLWIRSPSS